LSPNFSCRPIKRKIPRHEIISSMTLYESNILNMETMMKGLLIQFCRTRILYYIQIYNEKIIYSYHPLTHPT
jgi:hypothetical protein